MLDTAAAVAGLPDGTDDKVKAVLDELQQASAGVGLKFSLVAGAAAVTNIAIAGIATTDAILFVLQADIAVDTGTSATGNKVQDLVDRTSEASITSAGNIQLATTNTTGDKLLVVWLDKTP